MNASPCITPSSSHHPRTRPTLFSYTLHNPYPPSYSPPPTPCRYLSHFRSVHRGAYFAELRTTTVSHVIWAAPGPVDWGLSSDLADASLSPKQSIQKRPCNPNQTLTKPYPSHRCASSCPSPGASSAPSTPRTAPPAACLTTSPPHAASSRPGPMDMRRPRQCWCRCGDVWGSVGREGIVTQHEEAEALLVQVWGCVGKCKVVCEGGCL